MSRLQLRMGPAGLCHFAFAAPMRDVGAATFGHVQGGIVCERKVAWESKLRNGRPKVHQATRTSTHMGNRQVDSRDNGLGPRATQSFAACEDLRV